MTKKQLMVPYVECGGVKEYITYSDTHIDLEERMTFYHSFPIRSALMIRWEPAAEFADTLVLKGAERGRSAARLIVKSVSTGNVYQMFFADFVDMIKLINMSEGVFSGVFIPVKKGSNYAIKWLRPRWEKINV